jgi:hypothetical protein
MFPGRTQDRGFRVPLRGEYRERGGCSFGGRLCLDPAQCEYAQEQLFSCATNSAMEITDMIKEKGLNRVVVAACSPRTLEPLFRDTLLEAGLNQYYCDMANIREHNSWVHSKEKEDATQKAKDIVRMSVARAAHLEPLQEFDLPVDKTALVVGGGIAGMTAPCPLPSRAIRFVWWKRKKSWAARPGGFITPWRAWMFSRT